MQQRNRSAGDDNLSVVKAAAWAWYQKGSRSERKPEAGLIRSTRPSTPGPSRYKLEVFPGPAPSPPKSSNTLLDLYEIERITKELDRLIKGTGGEEGKQQEGGRRPANGLWVWHAVGLCGARGDAVVEAALVRRRPRRGRSGARTSVVVDQYDQ